MDIKTELPVQLDESSFLDPTQSAKKEAEELAEDLPDFVHYSEMKGVSDSEGHFEGEIKRWPLENPPLGQLKAIDSESSQDSTLDGDNQLKCNVCERIFPNLEEIVKHNESRRLPDKRSQCCNCKKIFRDSTQMNIHARKHTGEKPYSCNVCGKKFTVNGNLTKHKRIHTGDKRYECKECGRKFTQFAHLEDHLKTHSDERPFSCDICKVSFKTRSRLLKHKRCQENGNGRRLGKHAVKCTTCRLVFRNVRQLASHMANHRDATQGPFACNLCGYSFELLDNLKIHQQDHRKVQVLECTFCDKTFTTASHLRRHNNSHSGLKPYFCQVCSKGFSSCQNMKRHMLTHTGEKPFKCDQCEKAFLTLENMNRHKRTHTGEKPFQCIICKKTFAHSTTAQEHHRTVHTGEKPYGCSICDKKYSISKTLYRHMRERHPEHFPDFKKAHDITPNHRRALEKFSEEQQISGLIKDEVIDEILPENPPEIEGLNNNTIKTEGVDSDNLIKHEFDNCGELESVQIVMVKTEPDVVKIKTEPFDSELDDEKNSKIHNVLHTDETAK